MASCLLRSLVRGRSALGLPASTAFRTFATAPARNEHSMNELYMRAVEPKPPAYTPLPQTQLAADAKVAKLYTKLMWKRHRVLQRDLNRKLKLKWAAIHALPTEALRLDALVVDPYYPLDMRVATLTPPLAGFHGKEEAVAAAAAVEEAKKAAAEAERRAAEAAAGAQAEAAKTAGAAAEAAAAAAVSPAARGSGDRRRGGRSRGSGGFDLFAQASANAVAAPPAPAPAPAPAAAAKPAKKK